MDIISTVTNALTLGAGAVAKDIASDAAKKAYSELKRVVVRATGGGTDTQHLPIQGANLSIDPIVLRKEVESLNKDALREAFLLATNLLATLRAPSSETAYSLSVGGDVHNLVQGAGATVTITQDRAAPRKRKKRES